MDSQGILRIPGQAGGPPDNGSTALSRTTAVVRRFGFVFMKYLREASYSPCKNADFEKALEAYTKYATTNTTAAFASEKYDASTYAISFRYATSQSLY